MDIRDKNGKEIKIGTIVSWAYQNDGHGWSPDGIPVQGPVTKITCRVGKDGKDMYRVVATADYDYQIEYILPDMQWDSIIQKHVYLDTETKRISKGKGTTYSSFASRDGIMNTLEVVEEPDDNSTKYYTIRKNKS